jgi:hypothetical protein
MKHIKVVIEMTLELSDDAEIIAPKDEDDFPYIRINGQDYTLLHQWLKRVDEKEWTSLDDEEHEALEEATQIGTINSAIQEISTDEFKEAIGEE